MSVAFAIEPGSSIFRAVKNGDNALSPASLANVAFDAYGARVHGMTLQGIVPFSAFTGPHYYSLIYPPPTHFSDPFWFYTFTFPQPLTYCPVAVVNWQKQDGTWEQVYAETVSGDTMSARYSCTLTDLTLFVTSAGTATTAAPLAASYRLFGV